MINQSNIPGYQGQQPYRPTPDFEMYRTITIVLIAVALVLHLFGLLPVIGFFFGLLGILILVIALILVCLIRVEKP